MVKLYYLPKQLNEFTFLSFGPHINESLTSEKEIVFLPSFNSRVYLKACKFIFQGGKGGRGGLDHVSRKLKRPFHDSRKI